MIDTLQPQGYVFSRWAIRGEEHDNAVYEFVFTIPNGRQEAATGISRFELEHAKTSLFVIAGVLSKRLLKAVEDSKKVPPPSPA